MKKVFTPLLLLILSIQALAQSYSVSQDTNTVAVNVSDIYYNGIYGPVQVKVNVTNTSGAIKTTKWVRNAYLPSGWSTSVCDNGGCYASTVSNRTFPLGVDSSVQMMVDFFPNSAGNAVAVLHIFNVNDSADQVNPVFVAAISPASGIAKVSKVKDIYLTPVPARDNLSVVYDKALHPSKIEVYTILGQKVRTTAITTDANPQVDIDVSGLDKGLYFLRLYTGTNQVLTRQFSKD